MHPNISSTYPDSCVLLSLKQDRFVTALDKQVFNVQDMQNTTDGDVILF